MKHSTMKICFAALLAGLLILTCKVAFSESEPIGPNSQATVALEECGESIRDGQVCKLNITAGAGKTLIMDTSKTVSVKESAQGCARVGFVQTPAMSLEWLGESGARLAGGNTTVSFITTTFGNCELTVQAL